MEDQKIVELYWARSERALEETAGKYGAFCRGIARRILCNSEDAEECENDTYLAAWNGIPPARPDRLQAFLGRLTRNIALNKYDYNHAKKRTPEFGAILGELEACAAPGESVEECAEGRELAGEVSAFLRKIDRLSGDIFIRRYWYCDSVSSIACRFGVSEGRVKTRLLRTRRKLREYLKGEGIL